MEREWEPLQRDLAGLRVIVGNFSSLGPLLLSALAVVSYALSSRVAREGTSPLRPVAGLAAAASPVLCVLLLLFCTAAYVLCVASLFRATERLPFVPLMRLVCTFIRVAVPFLAVFTSLSLAALLRVEDKIMLPLWLLGWASTAYFAAVYHLACMVSLLEDEDAALFRAVRRSRELLAGKFWEAACVFVTLDGCIFALLKAFPALVMDEVLGRGPWVKVAAWVVIDLALRAVLVVTMVAQPVVYMICKSHHREVVVVDMAHLV